MSEQAGPLRTLGISAVAQAFLEKMSRIEHAPPPVGKSVKEWERYARAGDEAMAALYASRPAPSATVDMRCIAGVPVYVGHPVGAPTDKLIVLSFHGGALIFGGGPLVAYDARRVAAQTGLATWSVDYGMPPKQPFPVAIDQAEAVYDALTAERPTNEILLHGLSAGGNIACALLLRLRQKSKALPAALILRTPELDLTESGDSFTANSGRDPALPKSLMPINCLYAAGRELNDPNVSPIFADLSGDWPRTLLQSGTKDLFLSNATRFHRRLRKFGHDAELHIWDAMPHGGFGGTAPEDFEVNAEIRQFINSVAINR